jgi:hypothetical protein
MGEIRQAYTALNLDVRADHLDEDHIIGVFKSMVSDSPKQESELRQALLTIGQHRNSYKIEQFASNCK